MGRYRLETRKGARETLFYAVRSQGGKRTATPLDVPPEEECRLLRFSRIDLARQTVAQMNWALTRQRYDLPVENRDLTVADALEDHLARVLLGKSPGHQANLKAYVGRLTEAFGDTPLADLTPAAFEAWAAQTGLSPVTLNSYRRHLRASVREAVADGCLAPNPLADLPLAADPRGQAWRWIARDEAERLLRVLREGGRRVVTRSNKRPMTVDTPPWPDLADLASVLLLTGARLGEALALQWADVDRHNALARLTATKAARNGRRATTRHVPITDDLEDLFDRLAQQPTPLAHVKRRNLQRRWRAAAHAAGLKGLRLHDLRHTYASWLAQAGVSLTVIKELLGHADITTTQRYAHLCPDTLAATARAALNGQISAKRPESKQPVTSDK